MNEIVNQLAQSLFKKNSLQECSRWELEILADHYPYFGIAQFLVTGKLKEENAETYNKQLEKTSLYFTNPLWLDYVINDRANQSEETSLPEISNNAVVTEEVKEATPEETISHIDVQVKPYEGVSQIEDEPIIPIETKEIVTEQIFSQPDIITTNTEIGVSQIEDEPIVLHPITITPMDQSIPQAEPIAESEEQSEDQNENSDIEEPVEGELKMKPFKFEPLQDSNLKTPLTFEPFHTVDYFASQGIKVAQVEKPKDKFDQQLKSFTQWLKTIKKTPVTEISKEIGVDSEQKVITLAEHSIVDREIVTEAMAEVWTKQGNREKAIEVYHKLSLQNPDKSSYFAGLIEQLKQQ